MVSTGSPEMLKEIILSKDYFHISSIHPVRAHPKKSSEGLCRNYLNFGGIHFDRFFGQFSKAGQEFLNSE